MYNNSITSLVEDWIRLKKTTHFVIDPKTLYAVDPKILCTARKYIYYIRKDVIRHAISKLILSKTQVPRKLTEEPLNTKLIQPLIENSEKSVIAIHKKCQYIIRDHEKIKAFLLQHNISPYTCYYEDLCEHPEKVVDILRYLDREAPTKIKPPNVLIQTTEYNHKLVELYKKRFPFDEALHWRSNESHYSESQER